MKNTINTYNTTPEQQYLIHRARSERWEAERNRQHAPLRNSPWRSAADVLMIAGAALVVLLAAAVLISQIGVR